MYTIQHAAAVDLVHLPFAGLLADLPCMCRPSAYTISTTESRAIHGALIHHQLTRIGRVWEASIVEAEPPLSLLFYLFVCCFFTSVRTGSEVGFLGRLSDFGAEWVTWDDNLSVLYQLTRSQLKTSHQGQFLIVDLLTLEVLNVDLSHGHSLTSH